MATILFITAFPPNKNTAGQNYSRNLLNDLGGEHEIDVIYWRYQNHEIDKSLKIRSSRCIAISKFRHIQNLIIPLFPLFTRRFSLKVLRYLCNISSNYDIIYFDFSQTFIYSWFISHPMKIGMAHDVIVQKYVRKRYGSILYPWIKLSEKFCMSRLTKIFTFSYKDQSLLTTEYKFNSKVVPFYLDSNISNINLENIKIEEYFVMYGAWNRYENQESLRWVVDCYSEDYPQLLIIGGSLSQELLSIVTKKKNIKYLGFVENPYPIIAKSKGLIAPLFHGAGVKVKAIESLALGTPVIGTDVTFEGLPPSNERIKLNVHNKQDLHTAINEIRTISNKDKLTNQKEFNDSYVLRSFKYYIEEF